MKLSTMVKHITVRNMVRGTKYLLANGVSSVMPKIREILSGSKRYGDWFKRHRVTEEELQRQREFMFAYYNIGTEPVEIKKGDIIGQVVFQKFLVTDEDNVLNEKRVGGFGSTSK